MILTFALHVFASTDKISANIDEQINSEFVVMQKIDEDKYIIVDSTVGSKQLQKSVQENSLSSNDLFVAEATADNEIFMLSDDMCLTVNEDHTYSLANRFILDTNNFSETSLQEEIPTQLLEEISAVIEEQHAIGNDELEVSVIIPISMSNNINQTSAITPYGNLTPSDFSYRSTYVNYDNLHIGQRELKGSTTLAKAKAVVNLGIKVYNVVNKKVPVFGVATSLYDLYKLFRGEVASGHQQDEVFWDFIYNRQNKRTWVSLFNGPFDLGCVTYRYYLNKLYTNQYYSSGGEWYARYDYLSEYQYSEHCNDATTWARINMGAGVFDRPAEVTFFSTTVKM